MNTKFEAIRRGAEDRGGVDDVGGVATGAGRRMVGLDDRNVVAMRGRTSLWVGLTVRVDDRPTHPPAFLAVSPSLEIIKGPEHEVVEGRIFPSLRVGRL
jgi:hypothetical protein